ncbi:uncharacterized protein L201_000113 [Kwoniella dendrophila CBS 6074]|uniref:WD40 repeat-like protein n=1 Tax=Kwoniella dendrophila CBS 6074 TaxID=1295534 RepID=A0AAX4JJT2_9TREE
MSNSSEIQVENLAYIDIQHDALAVFDDVEQNVVLSEDIWISGYQIGETSIHGKAKVRVQEGGGSELIAREGVQVERISKTNFNVSIPKLSIRNCSVKFPKQVINPPYTKKTNLDAPLHINSLSLNPKKPHIVIGGPDGYCKILPISLNSKEKEVELKGHVGDVRDVKWFPSGEVILTASSDLSIRVYGKDGINPRTLRGHTRAITSIYIIGIGKTILSSSKDGTIRLWDISKSEEIQRWLIGTTSRRSIESMIIIENPSCVTALGLDASTEERVMILNVQEGIWIQPFSTTEKDKGWFIKTDESINSQLISISNKNDLLVCGYQNGLIEIIDLVRLRRPSQEEADSNSSITEQKGIGKIKRIRRNESPIYSLHLIQQSEFDYNLYIGTASGLPCCLGIKPNQDQNTFDVQVEEELAGWEAVGIETWDIGSDGSVWCAGGEGGVRRY